MRIDETKLKSFLKEVRSCADCDTVPCQTAQKCTPFIYGKPTSDILLISENPPIKPWRENTGTLWENTLDISPEGKSVPSKIARWLEIGETADERFFWIQRANCFPAGRLDATWKYCSNKFLSRAIDLVKPRVILTLGGVPASYFRKFRSLKELSKQCLDEGGFTVMVGNTKCKWVVFSHPSWNGDNWRRANPELHDRMIRLAKKMMQPNTN
jgi:uracil-DNA glycosylase